jgi:hypothetical protein
MSNILSKKAASGPQKKQAANSVKHIHGKLMLMKKLLEVHKVKTFNWEECIKYSISNIQHQAGDIRNAAYAVILELYMLLGKKIMNELESLRPSQSEILNKAFGDIDSGNVH